MALRTQAWPNSLDCFRAVADEVPGRGPFEDALFPDPLNKAAYRVLRWARVKFSSLGALFSYLSDFERFVLSSDALETRRIGLGAGGQPATMGR